MSEENLVVKTVDFLGRIVIPAKIRTVLGINEGDYVGMTVEGNRLVIKKVVVKDG